MRTVREVGEHPRDCCWSLRNPLAQPGTVWASLTSAELLAVQDSLGLRRVDPGGILAMTEQLLGPVTRWAILGDTVAGALGWANVSLTDQYHAVTDGAGAFLASAMFSLRVSGPQAGVVLDRLSPRKISDLAVNSAKFVLFTTPAGTVDEEAVVLRTGQTEFMLSCGGGKPPGWLDATAQEFGDDIRIERGDQFCFNIKGPERLDAVQSLVRPGRDQERIARLQTFDSCMVHPVIGGLARIVKNVIGYEFWADGETLAAVWHQVLAERPQIVPCGWDLLNIYRLECRSMTFCLYPLDVHSGTSLLETGYGWMMKEPNCEQYVGRAALEACTERRLWLGGIRAIGDAEPPFIGSEIQSVSGDFAGYVTSAAFSFRDNCSLAFAHLVPSCAPGANVHIDGTSWLVSSLPIGRQ